MKVKKDFVGAVIGTTFVENEFTVAKSVAASSEKEGTIVPIRSQAEKRGGKIIISFQFIPIYVVHLL